MMQKSISIKIEERVTGEYWTAWKGVFQNRLSERIKTEERLAKEQQLTSEEEQM